MATAWLILFAAFLIIEFATMALTTIWFAGGTLAAFLACLLGAPITVQILLFAGVSIVLMLLIRPAVRRYYQRNRTTTNAESLVGQKALVTETIDNIKARGKASVNGMEWTARSLEEEKIIETGQIVLIRKIEGVKLIVSPESESDIPDAEKKTEEQP